jgi:hypothetical protein
VLDHERGGEAAKYFDRFYSVTRGMIVEANIRATPESMEELINLYGGLREAWYRAELNLQVDQTQAPASDRPGDAAAPDSEISVIDDVEKSSLQWSA